jgi:hypothetical protein
MRSPRGEATARCDGRPTLAWVIGSPRPGLDRMASVSGASGRCRNRKDTRVVRPAVSEPATCLAIGANAQQHSSTRVLPLVVRGRFEYCGARLGAMSKSDLLGEDSSGDPSRRVTQGEAFLEGCPCPMP